MSTTINMLKLTFMTIAAEKFSLTLNYVDPTLKTAGADKVNTAAAAIIAQQPFTSQLASFIGAEFIDKTTTAIV